MQPPCLRLDRIAGDERPEPGVDPFATVEQVLADRPFDGEPESPGDAARGPVAHVGSPHQALEPEPFGGEGILGDQPHGGRHESPTAALGSEPEADLTGTATVAQAEADHAE